MTYEEFENINVYRLPSIQEYLGQELRRSVEFAGKVTDEKLRNFMNEHIALQISLEKALLKSLSKQLEIGNNAEQSAIGSNIVKLPGSSPDSDVGEGE
jgi:hypothetical protein